MSENLPKEMDMPKSSYELTLERTQLGEHYEPSEGEIILKTQGRAAWRAYLEQLMAERGLLNQEHCRKGDTCCPDDRD